MSDEVFEFETDDIVNALKQKNRHEGEHTMDGSSRFPNQELSITNQELNSKMQVAVREERRSTVEVLRLLREIEHRQVYAELGYSEAAASRRIEAMRAMREMSEIEKKIESGELSLSAVAQARVAIRAHERETKVKVSIEQKESVMLQLSGLSKRAAEKVLVRELPVTLTACPIPEKQLATGGTRLTLDLTEDEMAVIEDLRRLQSKTRNTKDLLLNLARKELAKKRRELGEAPLIREPKPKAKAVATPPAEEKSSLAKSLNPQQKESFDTAPTRTIAKGVRRFSASVKRLGWQHAKSQCEFVSALGHRCEARRKFGTKSSTK